MALDSFIHLFTHSFNTYFLNICFVPGIIPGAHLLMVQAVYHQSEDVKKKVLEGRCGPKGQSHALRGAQSQGGDWWEGSEETLEFTVNGSK